LVNFDYIEFKPEVYMQIQQEIVSGIQGACPDCRKVVALIPNPLFLDPVVQARVKELELGDCGRYLTVPHEPQEQHGRHTDQCAYGGRLPTRLVPVA